MESCTCDLQGDPLQLQMSSQILFEYDYRTPAASTILSNSLNKLSVFR